MENKEGIGDETPDLDDQPLSPVLCTNQMTRKYVPSKKKPRKTRVNLVDRFAAENQNNDQKVEEKQSDIFNDESFTPSQQENIWESIEIFEKIEEERSEVEVSEEFIFKKPLPSPFSKKMKALKGFQTADGKSIQVSKELIEKSKKLFNDILNPDNLDSSRCNKYSFLSKSKLESNEPESCKVSKTSKDENKITEAHCHLSNGFTKASGGKIAISESALESSRNMFPMDAISDYGPPPMDVNTNLETSDKEISILCSQETDTLFANFTAIEERIYHLRDNSRDEFKGFDESIIKDSQTKTDEFTTILRNFNGEDRKVYTHRKRPMQESFNLPNKKRYKSLTSDENKQSLTFQGFTTALGKTIEVAESSLTKAKDIFKNIDLNAEGLDCLKTCDSRDHNVCVGFKTALGNLLKLSENALKKAEPWFDNITNDVRSKIEKDEVNVLCDRQTDSSRRQNESGLKSSEKVSRKEVGNRYGGFQTASRNSLKLSEDALARAKQIFKDDFPLDICFDKENTSLNKLNIKTEKSESSISSSTLLYGRKVNWSNKGNNSNPGFSTTLRNSLNLSEDTLKQVGQDGNCCSSTTDEINTSIEKSDSGLSNRNIQKKKRLGISSCKPMQISSDKLERAKLLFADEKSLGHSPIRSNNQSTIYNSTPLKSGLYDSHVAPDITPIKIENTATANSLRKHVESYDDGRILIQECTKGNINVWSENLETERRRIEAKLKIILERQAALNLQKCLLKDNCQDHRKRRPGVLFSRKQSSERVTLQNYLKLDNLFTKTLITPKNAVFVHFNCAEQHSPSVKTIDGASIVPNTKDVIGLPEIETAFKVIPGVEPKLIPEGWVQNHFKWIVWKLASYERFTTNLKDCLTVENVMQQLKYRYDREIDRAERPTLRKIFEKDDVPQKRIVLCVSDIFSMADNKFELELTDGWYSIRTVIDEPLCSQVFNQKIMVGTKLVTCGAELLNCDGCHPLEATDLVRLKINCNSTRRAVWFAKLGYQKCLEPFPLTLRSLYPAGGSVGCIKIYIARVYPVKYMEKRNKLTVWRNKKAEELQAQNFENERLKRVEEIREVARKDYEKNMQNVKQHIDVTLNNTDIKNIKCPQTLYNLYQSSKDPESLEEVLSQTQKNCIMEYQQRLSFLQQEEVNLKIQDGVSKLQCSKRDVTPVQQLLVIDVLDPQEKACVFQIWRPMETHLQILKESSVFYVYNVLFKKNGLSSTSRTRFKPDVKDFPELQKYKRTLLPISVICDLVNKPLFNEFDTVGIIVQIRISSFNQALWLADALGKLLYVKIFEGPKSCLLLDNLKSGQTVAVSNLIFCESKFEFGEAIANHLTVISCYPQHKHLQEGIETFNAQLPKDLSLFLGECTEKVTYYTDRINITSDRKDKSSKSLVKSNSLSSSQGFDDSYEESTLIYSRITSTDVALSLIDIDKLT